LITISANVKKFLRKAKDIPKGEMYTSHRNKMIASLGEDQKFVFHISRKPIEKTLRSWEEAIKMEFAPSDRSRCKSCGKSIKKGELRAQMGYNAFVRYSNKTTGESRSFKKMCYRSYCLLCVGQTLIPAYDSFRKYMRLFKVYHAKHLKECEKEEMKEERMKNNIVEEVAKQIKKE
jgi:hypothetical protein